MKKIIVYITSCAFALSSCADYLEKSPLGNPSDQTFLATETEMEMALAACYTELWTGLETMPCFTSLEYVSDLGYDRNASDFQALGQGSADATNGTVKEYWKSFYAGIAKCNYIILNMERGQANVPAATYERIKGETRFLRAMYYSFLIELFGDVPLITEVLTLENSQKERTPKAEVAGFILQELSEAAPFLPAENNPLSGRATRGAAYAIKARTALYNEKWDEAISAASEVMKMEGAEYELESDFSKLFKPEGQSSKEIIFSVQYLLGTKTHSAYRLFGSRNALGHTNKKPAYQAADIFECTDGKQIDESPLFDPKNPYANRDPRLGYSLAVPGSEFLGFQFETHGDSLKCWNYLTNKRVDNLEATHAYATFTGLCYRKYANIEDRFALNDCETNFILMRYAEVLLIYAEAKIKAGQIDQSVLDAINKVRQRPTVDMPPVTTTDPQELFYAVARERKYEFLGEGLRLFDIRRWKIAETVMNLPVLGRMKKTYPDKAPRVDEWGTVYYEGIPIAEQGEPADFKMRMVDKRVFKANKDYLWPIPYIERQTNPGLIQNPDWE